MGNVWLQYGRPIVAAVLALLIGGLSGYLWNGKQLKDCREGWIELLATDVSDQALRDKEKYEKELIAKDRQIQIQANENFELRKKIRLDSADRMSLVDAMRSVNERYR